MSEDEDTTELDVERRTWNKLEASMKMFGFREGVVEGKNLSMQEGFNMGYLCGFKLGEYIGMAKGVISCEAELQLPTDRKLQLEEETVNKLSSQSCILCLKEKNSKTFGSNSPFKSFEELTSTQQHHSSEIIKRLKNSDSGTNSDKG